MFTPGVKWKYELVESATMERIGELKQARDRGLQRVWNRQGGASFTVPLNDPLFAEAEPVKHGIIAWRNKVPKWSGMIWTLDEGWGNNRMGVQCVGWLETLNHRIVRKNIAYPRFTSPPTEITGGGIIFDNSLGTPGSPDFYHGGLLTIANAQQDTWISEGTNTDKMKRIIAYDRGQNIGEAVISLSDTEAGFDFEIDPLTRMMNIQNWDEYSDDTENAVFGFNWGPHNLADPTGRQLDASTLVNRMTVLGDFGGGLAEDLESQQNYQLFEEMVQLSGVTDPNVLLGYAGGEIILRATPRVVYNLQPYPFKQGRDPEPFVDYDVGSKVIFSAHKPPRVMIHGQAVRVFGMSVTITNEGNEKLQALQVTPT